MKTHMLNTLLKTRTEGGTGHHIPTSRSLTQVPGTVLYLQGDGGCCKRIPVNPVSFFLQLIIFSTLHWDGSQLGRDSSMSAGMCNTRACTATFPRSLEIIVLSCRLPLGTPTYGVPRISVHLLSTQETASALHYIKAATILSKACGKACNGAKPAVKIKCRSLYFSPDPQIFCSYVLFQSICALLALFCADTE